MEVEVRLFAMLRERAGSDSVTVDLADGATVRDAVDAVGAQHGLRELISRMPVVMAVNREYADEDDPLRAGDELALIPPVSGGEEVAERPPRAGRFWDAVEGRAPAPPCAQLLGWEPIEIEPGRTRVAFRAKEEFTNLVGVVQGGLLAAMLDDTMGPAGVARLGAGFFLPTLDLKVNFHRPARPGRLVAEGRVVHMGRSIAFLAGSLFDEAGELVATSTATSRVAPFDEDAAAAASVVTAPSLDGELPRRDGPQDDSFLELVSSKAPGSSPVSRLLGSWPLGAEPGRARIEFTARPTFLNPAGTVQGGFLVAMLDGAMGPAAVTLLERGFAIPTLDLATSFVSPAQPGRLIADARVVHMGRSVVFTEAELRAEDGALVATATATSRIVPFERRS
jgi:molybdopterin converting factor subunit 1